MSHFGESVKEKFDKNLDSVSRVSRLYGIK